MEFFAVSPRLSDPGRFLDAFEHTMELAETHGLRGLLLFEGDRVPFDPWVLAQHVVTRSDSLIPLLAVGPAYVSAEEAARRLGNLHRLYGRPVAINLVAGAQAHTGSHAVRYQALHRFALILDERLAKLTESRRSALEGPELLAGQPVAMRFVAGHSQDAVMLAARIGAANLRMLPSTLSADIPAGCGLNFGVVTRPTTAAAWAQASALFPHPASAARVARRVASHTDSHWKAELLTEAASVPGFWRIPAQTMKADAPFFVGSYREVARLFADCRDAAVSALLLDVPPSSTEFYHLAQALQLAQHHQEHPEEGSVNPLVDGGERQRRPSMSDHGRVTS
jgi:alkanesulfonate monooxygenase